MRKDKPRYSKTKFLLTFAVTIALFAAVRAIFDIRVPLMAIDGTRNNSTVQLETGTINEVYVGDDAEEPYEVSPYDTVTPPEDMVSEDVEAEEDAPEETPEDTTEESTDNGEEAADASDNAEEATEASDTPATIPSPSKGHSKHHKIIGVPSWDKCFPDINDVQLVAARRNGVKPPADRTAAAELVRTNKLVNITNSPYYTVDDLRHSMPYLVPKAQQLLNTICLNFIDSLHVKGLPLHLPMVTSVLRTTADVARLQKGNGNATTNSCHCYGTTVDISYNRFVPVTGTYNTSAELLRWDFRMKQVLAEVLNDLRLQNKCYVKYERKQGCFHLTVR